LSPKSAVLAGFETSGFIPPGYSHVQVKVAATDSAARRSIQSFKARHTITTTMITPGIDLVLGFFLVQVKVAATDPAARRFIHSFQASLMSIGGEPWVKLVVVGQSFMLHQIRKMVRCMCVCVVYDCCSRRSLCWAWCLCLCCAAYRDVCADDLHHVCAIN
jgi:hypothetical protein